jgi:hypothetical protein
MKKLLVVFVIIGSLVTFTGCTENVRAKKFGGTMKVELPANKKLISATWKQGSMWYLTRNMNSSDTPETYEFKEKSNFGMVEGTILIVEKR